MKRSEHKAAIKAVEAMDGLERDEEAADKSAQDWPAAHSESDIATSWGPSGRPAADVEAAEEAYRLARRASASSDSDERCACPCGCHAPATTTDWSPEEDG